MGKSGEGGKGFRQGPDHLRLRGYVGIPLLGRTEVWTRVDTLPENRGQALPGFQP